MLTTEEFERKAHERPFERETELKRRVDVRVREAETEAVAETFGLEEFKRRLARLELTVYQTQAVPEVETRTGYIRFRVTPQERTRYAHAAADTGLKLSEWLRMRCERL